MIEHTPRLPRTPLTRSGVAETVAVPLGIAVIMVAWLVFAVVRVGSLTPNFDHRRHAISELGKIGAPYESLISYAVFLPVGLGALALGLLFLARAAEAPVMRAAAGLAICIAVGYLAAAFFHYRPRGRKRRPLAQWIHELGGAVEYLGGGAALWMGAGKLPPPWSGLSMVGALVIAAGGLAIEMPSLRAWRGTLQRLGECVLFTALIGFAYWSA